MQTQCLKSLVIYTVAPTATHCNPLQPTATHSNFLKLTATSTSSVGSCGLGRGKQLCADTSSPRNRSSARHDHSRHPLLTTSVPAHPTGTAGVEQVCRVSAYTCVTMQPNTSDFLTPCTQLCAARVVCCSTADAMCRVALEYMHMLPCSRIRKTF